MDSLLAYSAVCAGGLDTIPLPGDISEERLEYSRPQVFVTSAGT
jgi:uncharacterized protein (UPF0210 family)